MAARLSDRVNVANRTAEKWRPPLYVRPDTRLRRLAAVVRRLFDLQAASIWRDLAAELPHARGRVLDVGCGAQPYRPLLFPGVQYVGIDTVDAKSAFGYETPDTVYFEGDTWPIERGSVDVVLCTETLEHVPDPLAALREAYRCLLPGGRLLLTVPFAARWHFVPRDYWRFTPSGLARLLGQAGFSGVAVYARGNAVTVACYKLIALMLPVLLPQPRGPMRHIFGVLALPLVPLFVTVALLGRLSLRFEGGDDCLGYTASADRPHESPASGPA